MTEQVKATLCDEKVEGTVSPALAMMGSAPSNKLTKQLKCTETFMAPNGIMMERDIFYLIPTLVLNQPNPEIYSVGLTRGKERPKGVLFAGKNRKERRAEKRKSN